MKQDRFLVGILVFIGLLVAAALVLFFARQGAPAYQPSNTPGNVVYNFALALQQNDLERAYGYLADAQDKPSLTVFIQSFQNGYINVSGNALHIIKVSMQGEDNATVYVTIQYMGNGLFDSGYSNDGQALLVRQGGEWKITSMPYPYWAGDWYMPAPVPAKP